MKLVYGYIFFLILGLWLLLSPYTLGFADAPAAYWNAVIVGVLSVVGAAVELYWSRDDLVGLTPHQQKA
ncbi:MAG TPA: SPW repeat protein [Chthonomonadales bacterium]|nr:SPW repeat protein [Chthonomonadales bacterium]